MRIAVFLLFLVAAGCAPAPRAADGLVPVSAYPVDLRNDDGEDRPAGALVFRGGVALRSPDPRFGGFSGLAVRAGRLLAITDKGHFLTARLLHDEAGRLSGLDEAVMGALAGHDGAPISGTPAHDSEALAQAGPDLVIGLEGPARLWRYAGGVLTARPRPLVLPEEAARLPANRNIEAVAALADGRLLVLAETAPTPGLPTAWVGKPGRWLAVDYARTGYFVPVDAAGLPDGGAVVLERRFTWAGGLASRLVHVPASQLRGGGRIEGEELAVIDDPPAAENYEGLALRVTEAGETLIYLIADDNFIPLQRTLLLAFAWKRGLQ